MTQKEIFIKLEELFNASIISMVHCHGQPLLRTQLAMDILPILEEQFDILKKSENKTKLIIYIRSLGGQISPVLPIYHIARSYFDEISMLIHKEALSAATLLAIGGKQIIMSPSACLSPIDPQISLNIGKSVIQGGIEDIKGYLELVKNFLSKKSEKKEQAFLSLVNRFPPEILGKIQRVDKEVNFIAKRVLKFNHTSPKKIDKIIHFLSKEVPSHDYRIYRDEAKYLGLPIIFPDTETISLMEELNNSYIKEMPEKGDILIEEPLTEMRSINVKRGFIESKLKKFVYMSELIIRPGDQKIQKNEKGWILQGE